MKFYKNNSSLNFFISYAYLGLCYIFLLVLPVDGKAQLSQPEATKAQTIKQILAKNKFQNKQSKNTFCTQILSDLKTMNGITFMEPIARADSYDDPALAPFKKRCGEQPLNESFHCDARATTGIKLDRNWKKRRQQLAEICEAWYGTKNFKVFQLDINNNPKDGEELIVYYERAYGPENRPDKKFFSNGSYDVYNSKSCTPMENIGTHDPYSYFYERPLASYNGIIRYVENYYVIDLYELDGSDRDPKNPEYRLQISTANERREHWCSYSTLSVEKAIERNRAIREKREQTK